MEASCTKIDGVEWLADKREMTYDTKIEKDRGPVGLVISLFPPLSSRTRILLSHTYNE
jgi:hypothetical protein